MPFEIQSSSRGREGPAEQLAVENLPSDPVNAQQSPAPVDRKHGVFQASPADFPATSPSGPCLQTFEELGLPASFQKALEEELTRDEKLVWLGRPSQNEAVHTPPTALVVIGAIALGVALLLPWLVKDIPFFFSVILAGFGLLFLFAPKLFKRGNGYSACYAVTNRRAILLEQGLIGLDPSNYSPFQSFTKVRCKSYLPHELLSMERRNNEQVPGAGDLIFEYILTIGDAGLGMPGTNGTIRRTDTPQRTPRGFFFLDQVAEVENVIRATLLTNLENSIDQGARAAAPVMRPVREDRSPPSTATCVCGAGIQTPDDLAGQSVNCPQCGSTLLAPSRVAAKTAGAEGYREDGQVPADLKEKVLAELSANERLVWIAQPESTIVFRRSLGYLVGGGIVAAVMLFWIVTGFIGPLTATSAGKKAVAVARVKTPAPAARNIDSISIIFLAAGVFCMSIPICRWKLAQRSCYALTNRRALIFRQGLFGLSRECYSAVEVANMRRSDSWVFERGGDLIFLTVTTVRSSYSSRHGSSRSVSTTHYGFLSIAHAKEVEKLVRETLIDPFVDRLQAANSW